MDRNLELIITSLKETGCRQNYPHRNWLTGTSDRVISEFTKQFVKEILWFNLSPCKRNVLPYNDIKINVWPYNDIKYPHFMKYLLWVVFLLLPLPPHTFSS